MVVRQRYLVLWITLALFLPVGLESAPLSTRVESIDAGLFPKIEASVCLFTRKALVEPTRDDFQVTEDGSPIGDFDVAVDERPMYVALVLDRSGSMAHAMGAMKQAAMAFLDELPPRAFVRLSTFSDEVTAVGTFTRSRGAVEHALLDMRPYGATALHDATMDALDALRAYGTSVRPVVLVFTDGRDQNGAGTARQSRVRAKDVAQRARDRSVPLCYIGLGSDVNRPLLQKLASVTGGEALFTTERSRLSRLFLGMAKLLERSVQLRWTSPRPKRDGSLRKILVHSRLSGREDQGTGSYRAPSDPGPRRTVPGSRAGKAPEGEDAPAALGAMIEALCGLGRFAVRVDTRLTGWTLDGRPSMPFGGSVSLQADLRVPGDLRYRCDWTTRLGGRLLSSSILRKGSSWGFTLKTPQGRSFAHAFEGTIGPTKALGPTAPIGPSRPLGPRLDHGLRLALPFLTLPPGQPKGALALGLKGLLGANCELQLDGPASLRFRSGKGSSGRIVWDSHTKLPRSIVRVDGATGATTRLAFEDWKRGDEVTVDLQLTATGPEASREAVGKAILAQLDAGGALLRLGDGGLLQLAAPGCTIRVAAGKVLVEAPAFRLDLEGDAFSSLNARAGELCQLRSGALFRSLDGASWTDGTNPDWGRTASRFEGVLAEEAKTFEGEASAWAEGLDRSLEERKKRFLVDADAFEKGLEAELATRNRALASGVAWTVHDATEAPLGLARDAERQGQAATRSAERAAEGARRASDGTVDGALHGASEALQGANEALDQTKDLLDNLGDMGGSW